MLTCIDIGSTIVKVAQVDDQGQLKAFNFAPRDKVAGIFSQVSALIAEQRAALGDDCRIRICSSANGGLRVGLLALSPRFSGAVTQSLVGSAGANVIFTETPEEKTNSPAAVDLLIVSGGIDDPVFASLERWLAGVDFGRFKFQKLVYAGNKFYAEKFKQAHPGCIVLPNILDHNLKLANESLLKLIRYAYLDDLIEKEGVSELKKFSEVSIWPTPAVVNRAYKNFFHADTAPRYALPAIIIDIGGATTDLHFGGEISQPDPSKRYYYCSRNRFVFTELGISASKDSLVKRLIGSAGLYRFFTVIYGAQADAAYSDFRENVVEDSTLFYGCLWLALKDVTTPGIKHTPNLDINKVASVIITGGAAKVVDKEVVKRLVAEFMSADSRQSVRVHLDDEYWIWISGLLAVPQT